MPYQEINAQIPDADAEAIKDALDLQSQASLTLLHLLLH